MFEAASVQAPTFVASDYIPLATYTTEGDTTLSGVIDLTNWNGITGYGTEDDPFLLYVSGNLTISGNTTFLGYVQVVTPGTTTISGNVTATTIAPPDPNAPDSEWQTWTELNLDAAGNTTIAWYAEEDITVSGNHNVVGQHYTNQYITLNGGGGAPTRLIGALSAANLDINVNGGLELRFAAASQVVRIRGDVLPPTITLTDGPAILSKPNGKYHSFYAASLVTAVTDDLDDSLTPEDVFIAIVSSDEPEDVPKKSDGSTLDDIVIASDCKSVMVRSERDNKGNGRVYVINVAVADAGGNLGTADYRVEVLRSKKAGAAIDDGPAYTVPDSTKGETSACTTGSAAIAKTSWSKPGAVVKGEVPTQYILEQNFPNPFNPSTTISYGLLRHSDATLTIFDVLGRVVGVLASGTRPAGMHEVSFDATGLPSGIYFYRLEAGDYVETKRMVVVK